MMPKDDHITLGQLGTALDYVDREMESQAAQLRQADAATNNTLADHIADKNNPHGLDAEDVGAVPATRKINGKSLDEDINLSAADLGIDATGSADVAVSEHNQSATAHSDIRQLITGLTQRLNAVNDSTDPDMDQMSELAAYILENRSLIETVAGDSISVDDIVNDLSTGGTGKALSAQQGVILSNLIQQLTSSLEDHDHKQDILYPHSVELTPSSEDLGHGGYLDFHYENANVDYTTRMIEYGPGDVALLVRDGGTYRLLTEYNKPAGSYTGNGSTGSRSISVGGRTNNAGLLVITSDTGYIVLVGIWGAVAFLATEGSCKGFYSSALNFQNGVLKIASDAAAVNTNGKTYYYYVL